VRFHLEIALCVGACGTLEPVDDSSSTDVKDGGPDGAVPPPASPPQPPSPPGSDPISKYRQEVRADFPILWVELEEAARSTTVKDEIGVVGSSHTISGGCLQGVDGVVPGDKAVRFDGATCKIEISDANGRLKLAGTESFSIEAWVSPEPGAFQHIFTREVRSGGVPTAGYALLLGANATVAYGERKTTAANQVSQLGTLKAGAFSHVVLTFDGAFLHLYVDAVEALPAFASAGSIASTVQSAYIGTAGIENWYRGVIDEIAVYDKALASDRIQAHHDALTK